MRVLLGCPDQMICLPERSSRNHVKLMKSRHRPHASNPFHNQNSSVCRRLVISVWECKPQWVSEASWDSSGWVCQRRLRWNSRESPVWFSCWVAFPYAYKKLVQPKKLCLGWDFQTCSYIKLYQPKIIKYIYL